MTSAIAQGNARVFFALVPRADVRNALADLAGETARHAGGRPVFAENMHVTLAFIGAWPVVRLPALLDAAATVRGEAMRIVLDRQGAFRRAGIAWIGPSQPAAALMQLAETLTRALSAFGVILDEQPYRPHVTLARHCRGPYPDGAAGPFGFDADHFVLMQSQAGAARARYKALATWPLGRMRHWR